MLRITETFKDEKAVILKLDGKVIGPWVSNLEQLCFHYRDKQNKAIVLDFKGVTFIDDEGVEMLERIKDGRIGITNCSLFLRSLLCSLMDGLF